MSILRKSRLLLLTFVMTGTFGLVSVASASIVNVGGVALPLGSQTFSGSLYETASGTTLSGYGQITSLGGTTAFCSSGVSCSLTYYFDNYTLDAATSTATTSYFTGGNVSVYVQTGAGTITSVTAANATTGALWLNLVGAQNLSGDTLQGTSQVGNSYPLGSGFLSVAGSALANSFFDTNSYTGTGSSLGTLLTAADLSFSTSISGANGPAPFVLSGSSTGSYLAVPEPSDLGMMGFGLLMVGLMGLRFRQSRFRRD